jgi:serine/threonine-protein kinase
MREGLAVAGRYRLVERVGAGGMGEVWRAHDEVLGRMVAVKVVLPALYADPDFVRRFLAEARAMASVHHPGVIAIHDFGEAEVTDAARPAGTGRVAYIVMEYVEGEPLSQLLRRVGRLSPGAAMDVVSQTAQALQAVHNRGVVHRDVKPANLMIRTGGAVALADFGIAVALDSTALTNPGEVLGTPSYLAPEQVLGQPASALSDVYALGLVAYECLAGRKPFTGEEPVAVALQRVQNAPAALPPDVPPHVAGVVLRALATQPSRRWPTAGEFALAAEHAVRDVTRGSGGAPPRRNRWPLAVAAAGAALLLGVAATLWATGALRPSADSPARPPTSPVTRTTTGTQPSTPTGFVACGAMLCPVGPMCWRGLVQQGDRPFPPAAEECTAAHYWETFAVVHVPDDVSTDRQLSNLMQRPDIAAACSAKTMAERSRDPALTNGWRRDAWPIPADAYTVLVHCLAGSPDGESPGAAFRSG